MGTLWTEFLAEDAGLYLCEGSSYAYKSNEYGRSGDKERTDIRTQMIVLYKK